LISTHLVEIVHGLAVSTLPLLDASIIFDAGLLVAIEAYEIFPTEGRSHRSMIPSVAKEMEVMWRKGRDNSAAPGLEFLQAHGVDPCRR
jgi:hypothetical protein